jgi:DNA-directed RNA polymerase specialized sigma subunit
MWTWTTSSCWCFGPLWPQSEKFDAKNVAFQACAKHRIRRAILDSLSELDWASRDMRKRQKRREAVTRDSSLRLGRAPRENKVMGVEVESGAACSAKGVS